MTGWQRSTHLRSRRSYCAFSSAVFGIGTVRMYGSPAGPHRAEQEMAPVAPLQAMLSAPAPAGANAPEMIWIETINPPAAMAGEACIANVILIGIGFLLRTRT